MYRLGDVLDPLLALVEEIEIQPVADLAAHDFRARDAARSRKPLEACREVDLILWLVEADRPVDDEPLVGEALAQSGAPVVLVVGLAGSSSSP